MADELRWNLLEKYGLIGIRAPVVPPSRYTGSGKEHVAWRALEQEIAEWKALVSEMQRRNVQLTKELVRVSSMGPPKTKPTNAPMLAKRRAARIAANLCIWCKNPPSPGKQMCQLHLFKTRESGRRYRRRLALRRQSPGIS